MTNNQAVYRRMHCALHTFDINEFYIEAAYCLDSPEILPQGSMNLLFGTKNQYIDRTIDPRTNLPF